MSFRRIYTFALLTSGLSGCGGVPSVQVSPASPTVIVGEQLQFSASVENLATSAVTWSTTGGTITADGLLTAPRAPGPVTVTAKSTENTAVRGQTSVTVIARPVRLLSSTPANGATAVDRWAPIVLKFSGTVESPPTIQTDCGEYRWKAEGDAVTGTLSPGSRVPQLGSSCTLSGTSPTGEYFAVEFTRATARTIISADITKATTLTVAGSPYVLDPAKVLYLRDAALTLEPGVDFQGKLTLVGSASVTALGTPDAPIHIAGGGFTGGALTNSIHRFSNVSFVRAQITPEPGDVQMDASSIECSSDGSTIQVSLGTGWMKDSRMHGCLEIVASNAVFERNVVIGTGMWHSRFTWFSSFKNNYVQGRGSADSVNFIMISDALRIWKYNSFIGFSAQGFTGIGYFTGDLSENWWGTTDATAIANMVWDSSDDSQLGYTFQVSPFLTAPHPDTPTP